MTWNFKNQFLTSRNEISNNVHSSISYVRYLNSNTSIREMLLTLKIYTGNESYTQKNIAIIDI